MTTGYTLGMRREKCAKQCQENREVTTVRYEKRKGEKKTTKEFTTTTRREEAVLSKRARPVRHVYVTLCLR